MILHLKLRTHAHAHTHTKSNKIFTLLEVLPM